ncbi:MAG: Uma2 family endonuclease [Polyangiales bacterium]
MSEDSPPRRGRVWDDPRIRVPDAETWAGMSEEAREAACEAIEAALDEYREAMSEGVPHSKRKMGVAADLDAHFRRQGRGVLLANELAVLYPGESVIVPDVLAVMDADPDYEPQRWVVMREGRGVDVVVEVRSLGNKHKDLVENVADYARVRIPEYFSYDCRRDTLRGWRLPDATSQTYVPIVPQGGYLRSAVLGLDLAVVEHRLRFFTSDSLVPTERELVARLQRIVDERQLERDDAARERDDAARERDDALKSLARAQISLCRSVLRVCEARGLALTAAQSARVNGEHDVAQLSAWVERALSVESPDAIFERAG